MLGKLLKCLYLILILISTWSPSCFIINSRGEGTFATTDTKLYIPVVTLSTQNNSKLLEQLKFRFKRTINLNKYLSKKAIERQNPYLDYLIDPSFQGLNILFVLLFENENYRKVHAGYYLPKVEVKYYNVIIDGKIFFDQPVNNNCTTSENIKKKLQLVKEMITQLVVY